MFRAEFARHRRRNVTLIAIFAAWLAVMTWGLIALPGTAHAAPADQAPECVTVVVLAPQADGTTARVHLEFCGNGPGADSALHDWAQGHQFVLDGARQIGGDCGTWSAPCVIFPR